MVRRVKDHHESEMLKQNNKSAKNQLTLNANELANQMIDATNQTLKNSFENKKVNEKLQKRISKLPFINNSNMGKNNIPHNLLKQSFANKQSSGKNSFEEVQRYVGVVKPGKWLYQLSYHLKLPLHATFVSGPLDTVYCLTLPPELYRNCIGDRCKKEIQENIRFLCQCGFGSQMPQNNLILLANKLKHMKVKSHTIICKQDEQSQNIYFIKSGCVKVVRDLAFYSTQKYLANKDDEQIYREDPLSVINQSKIQSKMHSKNNSIDNSGLKAKNTNYETNLCFIQIQNIIQSIRFINNNISIKYIQKRQFLNKQN